MGFWLTRHGPMAGLTKLFLTLLLIAAPGKSKKLDPKGPDA